MGQDEGSAIIFGGSSGIGAALSALLIEQGRSVIIADLNPPRAHGQSEIPFYQVDVRDRTAVRAVFEKCNRVDYCFNCAGILREGDALSIPDSDWELVISINTMGSINTSLEAYRVMSRQGNGHIVNLSSSAALFPWPYMLPYVTSKYAVLGFSVSLRDEAASHGVRVSVVCPGNIETPMIRSKIDHLGTYTPAISPELAAVKILAGVKKNKAVIVFPAYARAFWGIERHLRGRSENLRHWYGNKAEIQLLPSFIKTHNPVVDVMFKVVPQMFIPPSFGEKYLLPMTKFLAIRTRLQRLKKRLGSR